MEDKPVNTLLDETKDASPPSPDDRMAMIQRMIEDPDSDPFEAMNVIKLEICTMTAHFRRLTNDPDVGCSSRLRIYAANIKALRELQRSIMDTELLRKRDTLNLDGEKAKFLINWLNAWFTKGMKEAGLMEETRNNVMKQYRDISIVEEPNLRRELAKMKSK